MPSSAWKKDMCSRSEEHTSELQPLTNLVCRLLLEKKEQKDEHAGKRLADRKRYYTVNQQFLLYHDLRLLFKKVQILLKQNLVQEIEAQGTIDFLLFTGRFMNDPNIPTDLLIVGSIDQKSLQRVVAVFESELGAEINYTLMPKEEFTYRRQVADRFLFSILEGEKVVMVDRLHVIDSVTGSIS